MNYERAVSDLRCRRTDRLVRGRGRPLLHQPQFAVLGGVRSSDQALPPARKGKGGPGAAEGHDDEGEVEKDAWPAPRRHCRYSYPAGGRAEALLGRRARARAAELEGRRPHARRGEGRRGRRSRRLCTDRGRQHRAGRSTLGPPRDERRCSEPPARRSRGARLPKAAGALCAAERLRRRQHGRASSRQRSAHYVKLPESGAADARELFVRHAKKDGRSVAVLTAVDYGDSCVVEAEVFPVGARNSKPTQPGPYTFADSQQATAFVTEAVEALMYLGCGIQAQERR